MLQTIAIALWTLFVTVIFGYLSILLSVVGNKGNWSHISARIWGRSILAASGIQVRVTGMENIDPAKSYIYMSNHQSNFDIPVLLAFLRVQFRWLAKEELFKIPFFGYAMQRVGYISINRSDRRSAFQSLKRAAEIIRGGVSVMIFPEGTRSLDGRIRPFKKGGFILALDAGVPIVPVVIRGTRSIMPKERLRIRSGRVTLEILAPIDTTAYARKNKDDLIAAVRRAICDGFYQTG
jgi:1-acyl-sn-glycerol-3-phosphate acyltransferase